MEKENVCYNYCYEDKFAEEDLQNRKLFLSGEIDENAIDNIAYHIMRYNRIDKGTPSEERIPIILYINSIGGNVTDGYGIIDAILTSETPVYTVNLASCFSMALLIFIAGHKRFSMLHSEFLLHDGVSGGFDSSSKLQDRMKFESEQIERMTRDYILNYTKINRSQYDSNLRREWYFLPAEGKRLGIVDYIVGSDCGLNDII